MARKKVSKAESAALEPAAGAIPEPPRHTKHQAFEIRRVHRSQLLGAPYNPRAIREANRDRLKENLKRVGLTHPLTWNETTGNLLAGHQRLSILDGLELTADYTLDVAVVHLDEKAEKSQNVFENNTTGQGHWDLDKMGLLVKDGLDLDAAGLDVGEVTEIFGIDILGGQESEKLEALAEQLRESQERHERIKEASAETNEADFYRVVVGRDSKDCEWLSLFCDVEPGDVFLNLHELRRRVQELEARAEGTQT